MPDAASPFRRRPADQDRRRACRPARRPDVRRQGSLRRRRPSDRRGQPGLGATASGPDAPRLGGAAPARRRRDADRQDRHRRGVARHPRREPVRRHAAQSRARPSTCRAARRRARPRPSRQGLCDTALGTDTRRLGARAGELLRPLRHPADPRPSRPRRHDGRRRPAPTRRAGSRATPTPSPASPRCCSASRSPTRLPATARRGRRRLRPGRCRDRRRAAADGARRCRRWCGYVREDLLAPPGLSVWARAQRTLQPSEAWLTFRDWLDRDNPRLAFSVARGLVARQRDLRAASGSGRR